MSPLATGTLVAGYRIERLLGSGGMGAVYLVANPNLPRYDALKLLSAQLSGNADFRARFKREADLAARLDHPNIVSIYDRGQTETGQLWIAMQFVDGTDAHEAGIVTPARAVHILTQAAKALDYAHQHGVVHRDIKPANLLLSGPVGPDERVLLGDFGIACALGDAGLTGTGEAIATLPYAAPEVLAGAMADARSDLYSLGCTFYRLLTGSDPFAASAGVAALVAAHLHAPPPTVSGRAPSTSGRLDAVIATALAKDPARRFSCAREFAAAAAEALSAGSASKTIDWQPIPSPVPPRNHPGLPPPPPAPRRRANMVALGAAVVVVVATVVTVAVLAGRQSTPSAAPAPASTPSAVTSSVTTTSSSAAPQSQSVLPGYLLTPEQMGAVLGIASMTVQSSSTGFTDDTPAISEKDCTAPYAPADLGAYGRAGTIGSRLQIVSSPASPNAATQAVIAFPSAQAARATFEELRRQWAACAGRQFTMTVPSEPPSRWTFGPLSTPDGGLAMTFTGEGRAEAGVQRVLTTRNNIIVDVAVIGLNVGNRGVDVANAIAAKIPQ